MPKPRGYLNCDLIKKDPLTRFKHSFRALAFAGVTGVGAMAETEETLATTPTMTDRQAARTAIVTTTEDLEIYPIAATDTVTRTTMKDTTDPDHDRVGCFACFLVFVLENSLSLSSKIGFFVCKATLQILTYL